MKYKHLLFFVIIATCLHGWITQACIIEIGTLQDAKQNSNNQVVGLVKASKTITPSYRASHKWVEYTVQIEQVLQGSGFKSNEEKVFTFFKIFPHMRNGRYFCPLYLESGIEEHLKINKRYIFYLSDDNILRAEEVAFNH